jgi:hypothetical protein
VLFGGVWLIDLIMERRSAGGATSFSKYITSVKPWSQLPWLEPTLPHAPVTM